ncbi:hypothetical protein [Streptomyces sp. NPDC015414]|uniref:hypothetical protein n=1 Tax=Streptomyces sp. NPDC015414 TaxID=3364957 RepID=UPI0036FB2670
MITDPTNRVPAVPGRRSISAFCVAEFLWYCAQRSRWDTATHACHPLHTGLLPAQTRHCTVTKATRGGTHFYTLEAVRADGSVAGTYGWNCVFQDRA